MQPRKLRVAEVERVRRTMVDVPEHRTEEVTLAEAVRMLSPEIRAMQAKGYGLPAVAEHLKENGLALSTKTLKAYLKEAGARGGRKKPGKPKGRPSATGDAAAAPTAAPRLSLAGNGGSSGPQPSARVPPKAAPAGAISPTRSATSGAAKGTTGAPRAGDESGMRRSAFVPKEDTRDI